MTVKEFYNLCTNNHWEDKELVIATRGEEIDDYQELTFSNVLMISDFYSCTKDDHLEPNTRITLVV